MALELAGDGAYIQNGRGQRTHKINPETGKAEKINKPAKRGQGVRMESDFGNNIDFNGNYNNDAAYQSTSIFAK